MSEESGSFGGEPNRGSRRRAILAAGGASLLGGLAGCQTFLSNDTDGVSLESSSCPAEISADTTLERWLLPVSREEYPESTLWYTSLETSLVRRYPTSFAGYLAPVELMGHEVGLPLPVIDRSYTIGPPIEDFPGATVLETDVHPESIIRRIRMIDHIIGRKDEYGDYDVYESRTPALEAFALGDGRIILAPSVGGGDVRLSSRERVERLIDLQRGDRVPYTCFHSGLDALFDHVTDTSLVNVIFRTDDATFGSDNPYVPPGAVAGAYSVTIDVPDGYFEEEREDGYPIHLEYTAVFPEREGTEDVVRDHVRENRMHDRMIGEIPIVTFVDPDVERTGRIVTARDTITFE